MSLHACHLYDFSRGAGMAIECRRQGVAGGAGLCRRGLQGRQQRVSHGSQSRNLALHGAADHRAGLQTTGVVYLLLQRKTLQGATLAESCETVSGYVRDTHTRYSWVSDYGLLTIVSDRPAWKRNS
jgi:hypothetical protein